MKTERRVWDLLRPALRYTWPILSLVAVGSGGALKESSVSEVRNGNRVLVADPDAQTAIIAVVGLLCAVLGCVGAIDWVKRGRRREQAPAVSVTKSFPVGGFPAPGTPPPPPPPPVSPQQFGATRGPRWYRRLVNGPLASFAVRVYVAWLLGGLGLGRLLAGVLAAFPLPSFLWRSAWKLVDLALLPYEVTSVAIAVAVTGVLVFVAGALISGNEDTATIQRVAGDNRNSDGSLKRSYGSEAEAARVAARQSAQTGEALNAYLGRDGNWYVGHDN